MIDSIGPTLVAAGFLTQSERLSAREANEAWRRGEGRALQFVLKAVTGRVP